MPEALSPESSYLMVTQLLAAGTVVLSKTQFESPETIQGTIGWLNDLIQAYGGNSVLENDVCKKDWDALSDADFLRFQGSGYQRVKHTRKALNHGAIYGSFITAGYCRDEKDLREKLSKLFEDQRYGNIIRVKGFFRGIRARISTRSTALAGIYPWRRLWASNAVYSSS